MFLLRLYFILSYSFNQIVHLEIYGSVFYDVNISQLALWWRVHNCENVWSGIHTHLAIFWACFVNHAVYHTENGFSPDRGTGCFESD